MHRKGLKPYTYAAVRFCALLLRVHIYYYIYVVLCTHTRASGTHSKGLMAREREPIDTRYNARCIMRQDDGGAPRTSCQNTKCVYRLLYPLDTCTECNNNNIIYLFIYTILLISFSALLFYSAAPSP